MKKYLCLALLLFCLTGCSISKVDTKSFDSIIKTVLYKNTSLSNVTFDGYKFYLPRGNNVQEKKDYNLEIKGKKITYYLYVDTIAYYYKTKKDHVVDSNLFYSRNLNYKNKFGYIDVTKISNKYFMEVMYNYAKIEAYVEKDNLYDAFLNMCYVLSTINFNDSVIEYKLKNRELETTTEEFSIFKSKKDSDNFLKYVEEFDKYESTSKDQDIIETEDN